MQQWEVSRAEGWPEGGESCRSAAQRMALIEKPRGQGNADTASW